ncbi:uncharacterized protein CMC5_030750 [Chondromyces crocatus]|uniref:Uncharacterized protein n=2 Tax=Chondromyces crocatus TaxID=52 RepID=A0A0K1EEC0_CHOCO|nr:uncharacterized protein CMC5_030750 [Chondromyces crocatus]
MRRPLSPGLSVLVIGLSTGSVSVAALVVAAILNAFLDLPFVILTIAVVLATIPLLTTVAARTGIAHPWLTGALAPVTLAPLFFLGALYDLNQPIIISNWRCGTGDIALLMVLPFVYGGFGLLGGILGIALATRGGPRPALALRALALGGLATAVALVAWSTVQAAHHPEPHALLGPLPPSAIVPPLDGETPHEELPSKDGPSGYRFAQTLPELDVVVERSCSASSCSLSLWRHHTMPTPPHNTSRPSVFDSTSRGRLEVRRIAEHDVWLVKDVDHGRSVAFRKADPFYVPTDISPRDLRHALSPPHPYIVMGALALGLGALLQGWRQRVTAQLRRTERGRTGVLGENGWISFEDATAPQRVAPDLILPPGPVVVLEGGAGQGTPYRGEATVGAGACLPGERAAVLADFRVRCAVLDTLTLTLTALTAMPLLAAWHLFT